MTAIFPAILAVSLVVILGVIAGYTLRPDRQTLSKLIVYLLSPALIVDSLYRTQMSWREAVAILAVLGITSVFLYGIVGGLQGLRPQPMAIRKSFLLAAMLPNNGNIGLPLVAFALGETGLERAVVYLIGSSILLFGVMPPLLTSLDQAGNPGERLRQSLRTTLKLPLIWAILGGLSLRIFQIQLPNTIADTLHQLGRSSIILCLILLGVQLSATPLRLQRFELSVLPLRLLIGPCLAFLVARGLQLPTLDLQVVVLQSAMPVAINAVVLAAEFGGDAAKVSRSVVASTLFALITLPCVLEILVMIS